VDSGEVAVKLLRVMATGRPASFPVLADPGFGRYRLALQLAFRGHLREAAAIPEEEALRVFVMMHEVAEGSWGAAGQVVRFEQLREAAREQREYSPAGEPAPA
jgi:hypothetical protein